LQQGSRPQFEVLPTQGNWQVVWNCLWQALQGQIWQRTTEGNLGQYQVAAQGEVGSAAGDDGFTGDLLGPIQLCGPEQSMCRGKTQVDTRCGQLVGGGGEVGLGRRGEVTVGFKGACGIGGGRWLCLAVRWCSGAADQYGEQHEQQIAWERG